MSKLMRALKKPVKKVLKPILPLVMVGAALGIIMVGLFMSTGWDQYVPTVTLPVTGTVLLPLRVVFITSLIVGLVVGGSYMLYRNNRERIHNYWAQYSTWAKSMIIGTVSTIFGAIALGIAYAFGRVDITVVGLGVLITWPLVVGMVLLGYRMSSRAPSTGASIKTAYVLTKGLESRTLSVIIGLLIATGVGLGVSAIGNWYFQVWPFWATAVIAGMVWLLVVVLIYNQYDKSRIERTDLTILDISTPESRDGTEITIKNTSGRSINLAESLIRDTDLDLYRPGFNYILKPGQCGAFEIDDSFSLEPNDDAIELPLGYNLKRGGETPAIFTKDGEVHYLQWTEQPAAQINRESSKHVAEDVTIPGEIRRSSGRRSRGESHTAVDPAPQD